MYIRRGYEIISHDIAGRNNSSYEPVEALAADLKHLHVEKTRGEKTYRKVDVPIADFADIFDALDKEPVLDS